MNLLNRSNLNNKPLFKYITIALVVVNAFVLAFLLFGPGRGSSAQASTPQVILLQSKKPAARRNMRRSGKMSPKTAMKPIPLRNHRMTRMKTGMIPTMKKKCLNPAPFWSSRTIM